MMTFPAGKATLRSAQSDRYRLQSDRWNGKVTDFGPKVTVLGFLAQDTVNPVNTPTLCAGRVA
jgi:hypothetical protein